MLGWSGEKQMIDLSIPVQQSIIVKVYSIFVLYQQKAQFSIEILPLKQKDSHIYIRATEREEADRIKDIILGIKIGVAYGNFTED